MAELAFATAFEQEVIPVSSPEVYSQSLRVIKGLGHVSLAATANKTPLTTEIPEVNEAVIEFVSGLEENIATDPDLSEQLTFNPLRFHEVIDNHVVDRTGRPAVDLVADGLESSRREAATDEKMQTQVERDEGDVMVAEAVDTLLTGEMLAVMSMDPKEALLANKKFWESKGYREGMAVLQVYFRTAKGLLAGAYALKDSDVETLRRLVAEHGTEVPEGENCNRWTRHQIRTFMSENDARSFGNTFTKTYRRMLGKQGNQKSTTEFLRQNDAEVQRYFSAYVMPLGEATVTHRNHPVLSSLALELLKDNASKLGPSERTRLTRVANSRRFSEEDARFMEGKIRYSLIEQLRPKLQQYVEVSSIYSSPAPATIDKIAIQAIQPVSYDQIAAMNRSMSLGLGRGVEANRAYGGCSSAGTEKAAELFELGTQDVFGGKLNGLLSLEGQPEHEVESDELGPLEFKCTKGCDNKRPRGDTIDECKNKKYGCKGSVGC